MPFSAIVGHQPIVDLLRRAAVRGRVPQSLLFAGPEGVGKRTTAIALAQALNCPRRKDGDACGTCPTCERIAGGRHSDVTLLDKGDEASIKIGPLRARVLDAVGYRPFEAERRVCVIDGADEMTEQAQDALLKTLEEPPAAAVLILVTAFPDALKPTVQSRCRRLRFGALAPVDVQQVLVDRCGVDAKKARVLAAGSAGSVSRALAADEGDLLDDRDAAVQLLTTAGRTASPEGRLRAATAFASHKTKRRERDALGARLDAAAALLRDLAVLEALGPSALTNGDLEGVLRPLARAYDVERLTAGFGAITEAREALGRNASAKIVSDWLALRI